MSDDLQPPAFRIYLLTVWQEHSQAGTDNHGWRFHLADRQTEKR
ncbi:MAG: hypothetical protein R3C14_32595 [Caldilineaceae bacterium]